MIAGRDSQPLPAFHNEFHLAWAESLGTARMLTRLIRDELATLGKDRGRRLRWILEAQERRRQHILRALEMAKRDELERQRAREAVRLEQQMFNGLFGRFFGAGRAAEQRR